MRDTAAIATESSAPPIMVSHIISMANCMGVGRSPLATAAFKACTIGVLRKSGT